MKILLTSGIFKPEAGGPSTYVANLAIELSRMGHRVGVITYSDRRQYDFDKKFPFELVRIKRGNILSNYVKYFISTFKNIQDSNIIYTFDYISAGIPSLIAAKLTGKKIITRTGGDLLWERYLSSSQDGVTMKDYYTNKLYEKSKIKYNLAKIFFKYCDLIIFNTNFQGEIFKKYYNIEESKVRCLANPLQQKNVPIRSNQIDKDIIWAGRMEEKNNVRRLARVFCGLHLPKFRLVLIGEGSLKEELIQYVKSKECKNIIFREKIANHELMELLSHSYGMILPSYTDISPNLALECVATQTPFIITQEHGMDWLRGKTVEFDPLDDMSLGEAIKEMASSDFQDRFRNILNNINFDYTYKQAAADTIDNINQILK